MMNRQLTLRSFGGPDVLSVAQEPAAAPGPGEVRIRVEASSLAFTDTLIRRNLYPVLQVLPPAVLGYDLVGRVDAVGPGVTDWVPGDRVADLTQVGGAQDYALRPAEGLVRVPEGLPAAAAEVMILSYMTAWQPLRRLNALAPGARLLVLGASGAVGLAALDLGRSLGLSVTGVASAARAGTIRAAGARPLPYDDGDPLAALREEAARGGGFDLILDASGAQPYAALDALLAPGGRLVVVGFSALRRGAGDLGTGPAAEAFVGRLHGRIGAALARQEEAPDRFAFYDISGLRRARPDWFREDLSALFAMLAEGRLAPTHEVVPLAGAAEAHRRLDAGEVVGRLVLSLAA